MSSHPPKPRTLATSLQAPPPRRAATFVASLGLGLLASCEQDDRLLGSTVHAAPPTALAAQRASAADTLGMTLAAAVSTTRVASEPDDRAKEYKVKAALLLNFLKYAKFPPGTFPNDRSPIKVLIIGDDPFGSILKRTLGKKEVHGRSIQIVRVRKQPKSIDAQLVFASGLSKSEQAVLIKSLKNKPTILVGETAGFAEAGGFINLYMQNGKVRFAINSARLKSTKVVLKAELLKLARIVKSQDSAKPVSR